MGEKAEVMLQVTEKQVERQKREAEGESAAELLKERNHAEAKKVAAEAAAYSVRQKGGAEADAIRNRGDAEASVLAAKAKAYAEYGDAAMVQLIVKELPGIAHAVAAPLCKAEKMVFVSGDGSSASKLTGDIGNIMAQLPDTVQALTGLTCERH